MMDFITVPVVVGIITFGIYKFFELFVCRKERLTIIEKMSDRMILPATMDKLSLPAYGQPKISYSALKAGALLIGIGLGLLAGYLVCGATIPEYFTDAQKNWRFQGITSIIYGSCVLLFGGIGLIAAFIVEMYHSKKKKEE